MTREELLDEVIRKIRVTFGSDIDRIIDEVHDVEDCPICNTIIRRITIGFLKQAHKITK